VFLCLIIFDLETLCNVKDASVRRVRCIASLVEESKGAAFSILKGLNLRF